MDAIPPERNASHAADLDLVRRALADEPDARQRLTTRLRCIPSILASQNARRGHALTAEDLDDLAQDVLLITWNKLETFEGRAALETWVYRIASLELMNSSRKKFRNREAAPVDLDEVAAPDAAAGGPEWVVQGLDRLSADEQEVIRLKHFDDLTFEAIGERVGISANTAKTRYYRGLEKLRRWLPPHLDDHERSDDQ